MKTIGLLGGIGPQATMDIERRLHRVAQERVPPHLNGGYPPPTASAIARAVFGVMEGRMNLSATTAVRGTVADLRRRRHPRL